MLRRFDVEEPHSSLNASAMKHSRRGNESADGPAAGGFDYINLGEIDR